MRKKGRKKNRWLVKQIFTLRGLLIFLVLSFFVVNFGYQTYRKPFEILSLVYDGKATTPNLTWQRFADQFKASQTKNVAAKTLAAIAQTESNGRVWASPDWQFELSGIVGNWWKIFAPASTAFGLMQLTDGHFESVKDYCIRGGEITQNCRFKWLTSRIFPGDSIELAAIYIHQSIERLAIQFRRSFGFAEKRKLAAIIHLCGQGRAETFIRNGLKIHHRDKCGSHNLRKYIQNIEKVSQNLD